MSERTLAADKGDYMDAKKMRVCAPLLPAPGDTVVIECLDEIDKLRAALRAIVEQCGRYGGIPPMRTRWERIKELANKASVDGPRDAGACGQA
jgi:hypothetical protein